MTCIDDPDAGSTVLAWHGPADRVQQQILDEARSRRIPVSVRQSKYSTGDVDRAVHRLAALGSGTGEFRNFTEVPGGPVLQGGEG